MCRNIRTLHNFEPPATEEEVQAAALQYVRKISGTAKPSKANEAAFARAVDEVAEASSRLLASLVTTRRRGTARSRQHGRGRAPRNGSARPRCRRARRSEPAIPAKEAVLAYLIADSSGAWHRSICLPWRPSPRRLPVRPPLPGRCLLPGCHSRERECRSSSPRTTRPRRSSRSSTGSNGCRSRRRSSSSTTGRPTTRPTLLSRWQESHERALVITQPNRGKGAAIRAAIPHVDGDIVVIQDADLEYDPGDVPRCRADHGRRRRRRLRLAALRRAAAARAHVLAPRREPLPLPALRTCSSTSTLTDMETGYKVFRAEVLRSLTSGRTTSASSRRSPPRSASGGCGSTRCRSRTTAARTTRARRSRWRDGVHRREGARRPSGSGHERGRGARLPSQAGRDPAADGEGGQLQPLAGRARDSPTSAGASSTPAPASGRSRSRSRTGELVVALEPDPAFLPGLRAASSAARTW